MTTKTSSLYERAQHRIPGGTQLLSKRPQLFHPARWPAYYKHAKGATIEDLDGRQYVDVSLFGVGTCPLGYADPDVDGAVIEAIRSGTSCTLNAPEEVELADRLCDLHPWADRVRYARSGGEAMAIAVRIARAATGKDKVLFSGYHGWHDWYLAANLDDGHALDGHLLPQLEPAGVPKALSGTVIPFSDQASFDAAVNAHAGEIAAVVMEPARYDLPPPGYLEHVREVSSKIDAVMIVDEITTGFRLHLGGLHMRLGVDPDIAVFAKAMSNGYAMAAIIGRDAVMDAVQRTFISSTYWTERVGPTAALATIAKLERENVAEHLGRAGDRMRDGWVAAAEASGLAITTKGVKPLPSFSFDHEERATLATLYTQGMLEEGYLASAAFYASLAHTDAIVDAALAASAKTMASIKRALDDGRLHEMLDGPVASAGLRKTKP